MRADDTVPTRALVLGMIRADGVLHGDEVYDVAHACGLTTEQVRLCLRRLQADGTLAGTGRGRRATFVTAQDALGVLPDLELVHLAFRQDAGEAPWDGHWHIVALGIPEARRPARDRLREDLHRLGAGVLGNGLYISPHAWERLVTDSAQRLAVDAFLTFVRATDVVHQGFRDPAELASRLWDLEAVAEGYRTFERTVDEVSRRAGTGTLDMVDAVRIALAFDEAMSPDPLLPPELLPAGFPARAARARLSGLVDRLPDLGPNPPRMLLGLDPTVAMRRVREATARRKG